MIDIMKKQKAQSGLSKRERLRLKKDEETKTKAEAAAAANAKCLQEVGGAPYSIGKKSKYQDA